MPTIQTNNITLYYEQTGDGPDLILLGGLTADHQVWKGALRIFEKHFRVLTLDNRGAGQSSAPDVPYTTELMASDVVSLMNALDVTTAHIVGHSMGGCIAQQIAIHYAEKINRCVLLCSRAQPNALANMVLDMKATLQSKGIDAETLAEYIMPFLFSESFLKNTVQIKGFIQWTLKNPHPQTFAGYQGQLHAVKIHDISQDIQKITTPTLVITGEEDMLMPAKNGRDLANALPNGKFLMMSDCAHMPHVEKTSEFVNLVLEFLEEVQLLS